MYEHAVHDLLCVFALRCITAYTERLFRNAKHVTISWNLFFFENIFVSQVFV